MLGHLRDRLTPATRRARIIAIAAVAAVIALVSAGLVLTSGGSGKQVTAYFTETIGVYPGSTVRILGVSVGTIDSVQPEGRQVKVTMTLNDGVPVPANAGAVVVAPSVVADRYIQLTPPYTSGPQLASDAVIPASRTATPVEVDQLYASLTKLATDLGPNGANAHGALSDAINTGAANLAGSNGKDFDTMITRARPGDPDPVRLPGRPLRHDQQPAAVHHHAEDRRQPGAPGPAAARPGDRLPGRRPAGPGRGAARTGHRAGPGADLHRGQPRP